MAAENPRIPVLHRPRKEGLGPAYLRRVPVRARAGAPLVIEMDCDFSHDPASLPTLIDAAKDADLVLGSRYVRGGGTRNWGSPRRLISQAAACTPRRSWTCPVNDLTGGFKCFRRAVLEAIPLEDVHAAGYGFQIEMTYRALLLGFRVVEIPIIFTDRELGQSKMSGGDRLGGGDARAGSAPAPAARPQQQPAAVDA